MDRLEAIERLARLKDSDVLTEAEFNDQKQRLLSDPSGVATDSRHCSDQSSDVEMAEARERKTNWIRNLLAAGAIVLILSMCTIDEASKQPPEIASSVPPTPVTARELAQAYDANEAAAQAQYGDRPLLVTGTVSAVRLNFADDPVIEMVGLYIYSDVQAALADSAKSQASSVSKGTELTLRCDNVTEVLGTPMLHGCVFQ